MNKVDVLKEIKLGQGIAELDSILLKHYIQNTQTNNLINGNKSIVLGAKGTGKSSILKYIENEKDNNKQLKNKKIIFAMNHTGEPVFKEMLSKSIGLCEDDLIMSWKIYFINLIWKEYERDLSELKELEKYLKKHQIVFDSSPIKQMITRAVAFSKLFQYSCKDGNGFEHSIGLSPEKVIEYIDAVKDIEPFDVNKVLSSINVFLEEKNIDIWIMIDRVDEAIINNPELETKALRALLRTFNDLVQFDNICLKLMLRNDLFNTVTNNGFAALSHISAHCTPPIEWDSDQLLLFIVKRIFSNDDVKKFFNINYKIEEISIKDAYDLFYMMFDEKVEKGPKKSKTFNWIYNHLVDGSGFATPRDFINYFEFLFSIMEKSERSQPTEGSKFSYKPSVFKEAWTKTSEKKLTTQIYAEYNELKPSIEKFKDKKARHKLSTLEDLLGNDYLSITETLVKIGFFIKENNYYEIPFLYRSFLNIKNGEA